MLTRLKRERPALIMAGERSSKQSASDTAQCCSDCPGDIGQKTVGGRVDTDSGLVLRFFERGAIMDVFKKRLRLPLRNAETACHIVSQPLIRALFYSSFPEQVL